MEDAHYMAPVQPADRRRALPLLCVTDRTLCTGDFLAQMQRVAALPSADESDALRLVGEEPAESPASMARPTAVLLREKDLPATRYAALAREVAGICRDRGISLVVHTHEKVARELGCRHLHLTLPDLLALPDARRRDLADAFELSTSCHSVEDALLAQRLGAARIIAGHVYETDCKPGLEPRGLCFLRDVCEAAALPVWAIGGVSPGKFDELEAAGAAGACMMSAYMRV